MTYGSCVRDDRAPAPIVPVEWLTVPEAARRVGLSLTLTRRLIASGRVVAVDLSAATGKNRCVRVRADSLVPFITANATTPA